MVAFFAPYGAARAGNIMRDPMTCQLSRHHRNRADRLSMHKSQIQSSFLVAFGPP